MSREQEDPQRPKPYIFSEISDRVFGLDYTATAIKEGIVIGKQLGMRYLKRQSGVLLIEFIPSLDELGQANRFQEEMTIFRRYQYHSQYLDVFLRATTVHYDRKPFLHFQIGSAFTMVRARNLGIVF